MTTYRSGLWQNNSMASVDFATSLAARARHNTNEVQSTPTPRELVVPATGVSGLGSDSVDGGRQLYGDMRAAHVGPTSFHLSENACGHKRCGRSACGECTDGARRRRQQRAASCFGRCLPTRWAAPYACAFRICTRLLRVFWFFFNVVITIGTYRLLGLPLTRRYTVLNLKAILPSFR